MRVDAQAHIATLRAAAQAAYKRGEPGNEAQRVAVLELERALRMAHVSQMLLMMEAALARADAWEARMAVLEAGQAALLCFREAHKPTRYVMGIGSAENGVR